MSKSWAQLTCRRVEQCPADRFQTYTWHSLIPNRNRIVHNKLTGRTVTANLVTANLVTVTMWSINESWSTVDICKYLCPASCHNYIINWIVRRHQASNSSHTIQQSNYKLTIRAAQSTAVQHLRTHTISRGDWCSLRAASGCSLYDAHSTHNEGR